ncbi:MAG: M16 family metallopeptidase [Hyphomonadaceae bacterium]
MRAILSALALALVAFAPASPPQALAQETQQAPPRRGVEIERVVSPGGIEAWLVSDATVPMIVVRAYWRGGAAVEPATHIGVTGVMADMLTEGAGDFDSNVWKERIETLNMSLGFSAGWDGVGMAMTTLSENRDAAFEMARLALASPRFDEAPLERIRRQIEIGIRQRETNPGYIANLALDEAIIPGHPYARRAELETIARIDRASLEERRAALLTRARLLITVVGDIDAQTLARLLDSTFGHLPQGAALADPPVAEVRAGQGVIHRPLPQPQSLILFAAPGIQDEDPDWIPLAVANYTLGGGSFSSRLMSEVRESRGLVYGISTGPSVRDFSAQVRGSAQTQNENVAQAIEVARGVMRRLHDEGPTQAEVDDAITYLTGSFALELDSNVGIAGVVHSYHVAGRGIDYINRRNDLIRAVTRADVQRVMRRLFDPDDFTFVVVGGEAAPAAAPAPAAPQQQQ